MTDLTQPKAFMSYSWTTQEHAGWVMDLAKRLRSDGVDVILDRWHLKLGQDKYTFMEKAVGDATVTKVLMVCDKGYAEKANGRKGGVGDETQIITPKVYGRVEQRKFIPIIAERDEQGQPYKPDYLQARLHIDLSDPLSFEEGYEDLLRDIYEKPLHTPPPVGQPPAFLSDESKAQRQSSYKLMAFKGAVMGNKPTVPGLADDYLRQLLRDIEAHVSQCVSGDPQNHEDYKNKILVCIGGAKPYRDEYIDFLLFLAQYGSDQRAFASVQRFLEPAVGLMFSGLNARAAHNQAYRFIIPELFLYTLAAYFAYGHYDASAGLLSHTYVFGDTTDPYQTARIFDYLVFQPHVAILEQECRPSFFSVTGPTAKLLIDRADNPVVNRSQILDVDYVLYARHLFNPSPYGRGDWRCLTRYSLDDLGPMPFFLKARSRAVFAACKVVLSVADKQDLVRRFDKHAAEVQEAAKHRGVNDWSESDRKLMGIEQLDTQ